MGFFGATGIFKELSKAKEMENFDYETLFNQNKQHIIKSFLNYEFNERTKEQFENDLESALTLLNEYGT